MTEIREEPTLWAFETRADDFKAVSLFRAHAAALHSLWQLLFNANEWWLLGLRGPGLKVAPYGREVISVGTG